MCVNISVVSRPYGQSLENKSVGLTLGSFLRIRIGATVKRG